MERRTRALINCTDLVPKGSGLGAWKLGLVLKNVSWRDCLSNCAIEMDSYRFWRPNFKENVPIYTLYPWRYVSPMFLKRNASAPSVTLLSDSLNLLKALTSITSR
ncbi:hypothetical protein Tco_0404461 [Tanacetum coccineum]